MIPIYPHEDGSDHAVLVLSLVRFGDALGNGILFIILPLYVAQFTEEGNPVPVSFRTGILIAVYGLTNAGFQPISGALADRLNRRKYMIVSGLVVVFLSSIAFLFARDYADLVTIRFFQSIGIAMTIPASLALISGSGQRQKRGESMGIYTSLRASGFAIGPLVGGFLYSYLNFQAAFISGALLVLFSTILLLVWVEDKPSNTIRAIDQIGTRGRGLPGSPVVGLWVATLLMAASFSMMSALENEFIDRLQQSVLGFSFAFSSYTLSRILVQIPLARLSDHAGRKTLIIAGLLLAAPATGLLGEVQTTSQLIGLRLLQGLATAGVSAPSLAMVAELSQSGSEARQMSMLSMGFALGVALGPFVAGTLAVYAFELPFYLFGFLLLLAAWIVIRYVPETVKVVTN